MPRMTFTAGSDALASEVNTYLMDQAVQTYASASARNTAIPSPTEGQLTYLSDINQYQASHGGSTWYPVAGQMPLYDAGKTGTQNLGSGSENTISWNTATVNRGGFTIASNILTVPHTGLYDITALIGWSGNATGYRIARLYVNGSIVLNDYNTPATANAITQGINITGLTLTANDTIEIRGLQNSGATLTIGTASRLLVRYVCP
jgi:hypothetical protein